MGFIYYSDLFFTTASIYGKQHLLKSEVSKKIMIEALNYLTVENRVIIYAFVLMSNHIHIVWQMNDGEILEKAQHSLLSYTSKKLKTLLAKSPNHQLEDYLVNKTDRKFQIWKSNPLSIALTHDKIILQKINYIHSNPTKANLVADPTKYVYSSCRSYATFQLDWPFLTLWRGQTLI